jgi:ketosteroid isomerase-like protein
MKAATVLIVGVMAFTAGPRLSSAPDRPADEAAIRRLIGERDAGKPVPSTPDRVFWTAAFQQPVVGTETPTPRTHERGLEHRVPGTTKNDTQVRRIVIADSGDLAYEYSDGTLSFDLVDGQHISSPNSTLCVWQKEGGQWKQAAIFRITHYRD